MTKRTYEAPKVAEVGVVAQHTLAHTLQSKLDMAFPAGTPQTSLTGS